MEDDNGIELSLGLSFGGTACKSRSKDSSSLDINTEDGAEKDDVMGDLKNFLTTNIPAQDSDNGLKRSDAGQTPQENFFTNLGKSASVDDSSMDLHGSNAPQFVKYGGLWDPNGKAIKIEEENHEVGQRLWPEASNKRKGLFEEMNRQKKHEREVHSDEHDKTPATVVVVNAVKTTNVSETTGNGLSNASEDAAESRAEGSISRAVSHHEGGSKPDVGGGGSSRTAPKENHGFTNSSVIDFQGQKSFDVLPGNESKGKNLAFGDPFSLQPLMTAPYSGIVDSAAASSTPGFHMPSMIQLMPPANREGQLAIPAVNQAIGSSEALLDERNAAELTKGSGKQHVVEEAGVCASSQLADGIKESSMIFRSKEAFQQIVVQGFSPEGSAIKPGIATGLKFGGSGSYPDLPWVCTRSPEPNGRTISGVTYKYDKNQIKIICACHGSHMSPEEFVQHASADQPSPENNTGLTSYSSSNPATSAKS